MRTSVLTLAYNHERFIGQAIESVLAQEDQDYELVIAEDCSTDGTRELVRAYARDNPKHIRLIESETNVGARTNFVRALATCKSPYLALLDGDDYYTSPRKLGLQADYLDQHPECATAFSASIEVDPDGEQVGPDYYPPGRKPRYTLRDILPQNLASSCTVMFRRPLLDDLPDWFDEIPVGDWPMHVLSACHGELAYFDQVMAAHRIHPGGRWAGRSGVQQMEMNRRTHDILLPHLEPEHGTDLRACVARAYFKRAREHRRSGEFAAAKGYLEWCRTQAPGTLPWLKFWKLYARVSWAGRGGE